MNVIIYFPGSYSTLKYIKQSSTIVNELKKDVSVENIQKQDSNKWRTDIMTPKFYK